MNQVTRIGIVAAVVAAVAGGSYAAYASVSNTTTEAASESTPSVSANPSADAVAADGSAPTPTETPWPYTTVPDGAAIFLKAMHADGTLLGIAIPTDVQLMAAGRAACDNLAAGVHYDAMNVIADDPNPVFIMGKRSSPTNSSVVASLASQLLCTEYSVNDVPVIVPTNPTHP
jgi:hypothetical protein